MAADNSVLRRQSIKDRRGGPGGEIGFFLCGQFAIDARADPHVDHGQLWRAGAKWGYENWEQDVLPYHPDIVTIWWGFNDLQGCGGFFDEQTDALVQYKLQGRIDENIRYLQMQIDALLDKKIAVYVMTAMPITGDLPWSRLDSNLKLIWDYSHHCNYNLGLKQLADAQRELVTTYAGRTVFLVDAWQIFMDHRTADGMYVDIMHPGTKGAELLAEGWLRVFQSEYPKMTNG
jgi:lysophospholipase L1-like esterase